MTDNEKLNDWIGKYYFVNADNVFYYEPAALAEMEEILHDETVGQVCMRVGQGNYLGADCVPQHKIEYQSEPEYAESSCFMMRTDLARKYGLFDESYKTREFRDADLSFRLRADGYKIKTVDVKWSHTGLRPLPCEDAPGQRVIDEQRFRKQWASYLYAGVFNKTFTVIKIEGNMSDIFCIGRVLEQIKKQHDGVLGIMTRFPQTLKNHPSVDCFIEWDAPVICNEFLNHDARYEYSTGVLYVTDDEHAVVNREIGSLSGYVTLDLSDAAPGVKWPFSYYEKVAKYLTEHGEKVLAIGFTREPDEDSDYFYMDLRNKFPHPLPIAVVMSRAKLHIGHDGLLRHFAESLEMPHITLYGATLGPALSSLREPFYDICSSVVCQGCAQIGRSIVCRRRGEEYQCMRSITPEMVIEKIEKEKLL